MIERGSKEIMVSDEGFYEIEALRVGGEFDGKIRAAEQIINIIILI